MSIGHSPQVFCIAWYDAEQWGSLTEVAEDSSTLDDSYHEWLETALRTERDLQVAGAPVTRVAVDVSQLLACFAINVYQATLLQGRNMLHTFPPQLVDPAPNFAFQRKPLRGSAELGCYPS